MKTETIELKLPKEVVDILRSGKVSMKRLRNAISNFLLMELIAHSTKIRKSEAIHISEGIKLQAWRKMKKSK